MTSGVLSLIILVIVQLTSLACALYVLIQLGKKRSVLRCLQNHLIVCLLFVSTWLISVDLLSTELYYWNGIVPIQTAWACRLYNLSFFSVSGLNRMFMAFMSVQRHILVFHIQVYHTYRARILFHYIPIIIIILWQFIYSIVTDTIVTCPQNRFRYTSFLCGYTCSILLPELLMVYVYIEVFLPTMITIIACILLPIRFALKKRNLQRFQWRRARKMVIQMAWISSAYLLCWFPYATILQLLYMNSVSLSNSDIARFLMISPYITSVLTPFICFYTTPTWLKFMIVKHINRYRFKRHLNTVHPCIRYQNRIGINQ
jgi:hypothetical protein